MTQNDDQSTHQEPLLVPAKELPPERRPQIHLFKNQIILNPTISKINFAAYLLFQTYTGAVVIPAGLLLLPLLTIVYGVSYDERINISTIVNIAQLVTKLLVVSWFGAICDKYGRKPFMIAGVILICSSMALTPNLPGVYPWYVVVQVLMELGVLCTTTAPLLADYIDYETKGRMAGFASVINYCSASVSTYLASLINLQENIPSKLHEVAILGAIIGFVVCLGLKGGPYHKALFFDRKAVEAKQHVPEMVKEETENEYDQSGEILEETLSGEVTSKVKVHPELQPRNPDEIRSYNNDNIVVVNLNDMNLNDSVVSRRQNQVLQSRITNSPQYKPGFMAGIREAKHNPWILTGYISGFLFYANVMLVNTVLVNYCTYVTGNEEGANQAYALTNKHMIVGILAAIFFGFFLDKFNKFKILLFVVIDSIAGVALLLWSPTLENAMAYISMVFFGISCSGFSTITNQLISKYPTPKYRASVQAISSATTMLGGAMTSILGVFLSKYNAALPFYMYLGSATAGLILLLIIYSKKRSILDKL